MSYLKRGKQASLPVEGETEVRQIEYSRQLKTLRRKISQEKGVWILEQGQGFRFEHICYGCGKLAQSISEGNTQAEGAMHAG